jgi:hypothetical protein
MKIPSRFLPIALMIAVPAFVHLMPYILGALKFQDVTDAATFLRNYSPIPALFLFGGAQFAERRWAYLCPLITLLVSDLGIGLLRGDMSQGFHAMSPVIYGSYALMIWLGTRLRERRNVLSIAGSGLAAEAAFFLITNFATWAGPNDVYQHTLGGLMVCYAAGVPFFGKQLACMAVYGFGLFAGVALLERKYAAMQPAPARVPELNQPSAV